MALAGHELAIRALSAEVEVAERAGRHGCVCGRAAGLVSIGEAAHRLGLHRATVYRMLDSGQLPIDRFQVGNTTKLSWLQIEDWLRAGPAKSVRASSAPARTASKPGAGLQAPRRVREPSHAPTRRPSPR